MDAAANNVNERNVSPTRMDEIKPKVIENLEDILFREGTLERFITLIKETGALIAGGFLLHSLHDELTHNNKVQPRRGRTRNLNRPDIDIYVPMEHANQFMSDFLYGTRDTPSILQNYQPKYGAFKSTMYCQSFLRRNGIQTIYNILITNLGDDPSETARIEFDIMIIRSNRTPLQVVNNFDLTFCQVWFDGDHVYASHPEDVRNKSGTLQGDYVNLFIQGNEFLQNRLKKYRTRGYEVRLDPARITEIAGNPLTTISVCGEESREAILKHWTSRVMLYWLLDVRDEFIGHDNPLTPSLPNHEFMAVPLRVHKENIPKGNEGDHFIQAHRVRDNRMKMAYPKQLNGYDSEDYEDDESLYPILGKYFDQEWNAAEQKLQFYRETNKLIEMINWPNIYQIDAEYDQYYETMGHIFDSEYDDYRKEYFKPFYDALRERCIRKSNQPYAGYDSNNVNDELSEVFDIHVHPLNRAATAEHIEAYLRASHMGRDDKNTVPCYSEGCNKPLTLSQVKYIVSPEFYREYSAPLFMRRGLDQVIELFDPIKENTPSVDPGFGTIYHDSICPFCLQPISRSEGCMYLTHAKEDDFHPEAPFCQTKHLIREIYDKYREAARIAVDADDFGPFELKLEMCSDCGRPCNTHHHFSSAPPYNHYLAGLGQGRAEYGICPGGGRAELFARILAIREVYRTTNGISSMEERRLAANAADDAPNNEELMAKGREILAMAPAERVWGNADLPREKTYTNAAHQENVVNAHNDIPTRRRRVRERYDAVLVRVNRIEEYQPIDRQELREKEGIVELHDEVRDAMGNLEERNSDGIENIEEDLNALEIMVNNFFRLFIHNNNNEAENAPAENNLEFRRQELIGGYAWLQQRLNDIMDEEMAPLAQPIVDALDAIRIIGEPEFAEVQNLEHYEQEMDRIQEMIEALEGNQNNENNHEIFNGGRFNRSRKKKLRRKQKTFRKLLKKLK